MGKENVVYIHNGALFSNKKEGKYITYRSKEGNGDHQVKQN
jgi:hypothetical protein